MRNSRTTPAILLGAALICAGAPAHAQSCPVTFVSPANGTREVARYPVITVAFGCSIAGMPLSTGIRLFDRIGRQVNLSLFQSPWDDTVVIATPGWQERLEPASDYLLEVTLTTTDPAQATRVHFSTGSQKSVFCNYYDTPSSKWLNACDENYYLKAGIGDPDLYLDSPCLLNDPEPGGTCSCAMTTNTTLGGLVGQCSCTEETPYFWPGLNRSVVKGVVPAAGSNLSSGLSNPIALTLDHDIGADAAFYGMKLEDITLGQAAAVSVPGGTQSYSPATRTFSLSNLSLQPNRRYRMTLALMGASAPTNQVVSVSPHAFEWTFNTWNGPVAPFDRTIPSARTDGVSFPTHLPAWPHLRFLYEGPVPYGLGDVDGERLVVRDYLGNPYYRSASWIDQDLTRLHLMVFETLPAGRRYSVSCTPAFAAAVGSNCDATPLGHFTTQVAPPDAGTGDIRVGTLSGLTPAGEVWLAARPAVINFPSGMKERYATDGVGPTQFLGHVQIVPEPPGDIVASITVNPAAGCVSLGFRPPPDPGCQQPYFIASDTSCTPGLPGTCPAENTCTACPTPGNAACPAGGFRCRYDADQFSRDLGVYCKAIVGGAQSACSFEEALRCVAGETTGCDSGTQNRLLADQAPGCPATYYWEPSTGECFATGKMALNFVAGEHRGSFVLWSRDGRHYDTTLQQIVDGAPPVILQRAPGALGHAVMAATVSLPATGLTLPSDVCRTTGENGANGELRCEMGNGVCDAGTYKCVPADPAREFHTSGATCTSSANCPTDYICNDGICVESCSTSSDCDQGYSCTGSCTRPRPCATSNDCFAGFTCDHSATLGGSAGICIANLNSTSFSYTGGVWKSRWVKLADPDPEVNIWRIWWPTRVSSGGGSRHTIAARIGPAAGGPMTELPLLSQGTADYSVCLTDADPNDCYDQVCDDWNDKSYAAQLLEKTLKLKSAAIPAPYGLWAVGYKVLTHGVTDPSTQSCAGTPGLYHDVSIPDLGDGPQGLYVKLPYGETPANYRIEAAEAQSLGFAAEATDLTFRGLTMTGYPTGMLSQDVRNLTLIGNQIVRDPTAQSQSIVHAYENSEPGTIESIVVSGNYLHNETTVHPQAASSRYATTNNLFWKVPKKLINGTIKGAPVLSPVVCTSSTPDCVRPSCRVNSDCRIPFWDGSSMTVDPEEGGDHATCSPGPDGVGTCSHGLINQGLLMDNVILDGQGPNIANLHLFRMQRNHFENTAGQEQLELYDGATYGSVLDNESYNSSSTNQLMTQFMSFPSTISRGFALEGNLLAQTSPAAPATRPWRFGPGHNATFFISANGNPSPPGEASEGLRIVDNVMLHRPGGSEWGDWGGVSASYYRGMLLRGNTLVAETQLGLWVRDQASGGLCLDDQSTGIVESNLVLPTSRPNYRENLCFDYPADDDVKICPATSSVVFGDNASLRVTSPPANYHILTAIENRDRLFREPLPASPIIDFETFQKHLVPTPTEEYAAYRNWPSYEPALLDDVLQVRPEHAACGYGFAPAGSCTDPDADDDLYENGVDVCPTVSDPGQEDTDDDGTGDACDTCMDTDGDGAGDPGFPANTCPLDCAPSNPQVHPGAPEDAAHLSTCTNGLDDDCDGTIDYDCAVVVTQQSTLDNEGQVTGGSLQSLGAVPDGNAYETILETAPTGPTKYRLTQSFRFVAPAGISMDLRVEGYRSSSSGDNFLIRYATPGNGLCPTGTGNQGWTSTPLSITKTVDDGIAAAATLGSVVGTVWCVRFQDSVRSSDSVPHTLLLDRLYLFPTP